MRVAMSSSLLPPTYRPPDAASNAEVLSGPYAILIAVEIDQVEAFVAIVRGGGFTRAASALHLSQPAVSRRLDLLETELGAPLFDRIRSGVVLTEAGKAFLPHAEALLASMRDGIEAVRALEGPDRGAITLALVGTLASTALTGCLERFREAYPKVKLELRTALSREVSALVRRGDATLGLRYGPDAYAELVSTVIYDEPRVVVCSPRHRLARARNVGPRMLAGEPWIAFPTRPDEPDEPYGTSLRQCLAACGLGAAEIIGIDSLTAQKRMVEAGFGLALLPESSVDEELRTGTLHALAVSAMRVTLPVVLIHRRRAYLSGAARQLLAVLTAAPSSLARRRRRTNR
jgi:DNA-binding transcriptional LysR family regulator